MIQHVHADARTWRLLHLILIGIGIVIALIILLPAVGVSFFPANETSTLQDTYERRIVRIRGVDIDVMMARSSDQWSLGLSKYPMLQDNQGMLFVFPEAEAQKFWMKDMFFDLDMIFIRDGLIVEIAEDLPAPSGPGIPATYTSEEMANMVLEVNSGTVERNGWRVGDAVMIQ